ncbi:MAG: DNA glycosylase AlkZ-like family protein, partial [Nocardioidaceae bacterium]
VQVTPRGVWGSNAAAALQTIESWIGRPLDPAPSIDELMLRYLRAFGPASVKDAQEWSGLTRLREVMDRLGPSLRTYLSPDGTTLYDVPEAPRPDPDIPAPARFLPEYDNVLLSHADRTRVNPDGRRVPLPPGNGANVGTVLVDGEYQADWRSGRKADSVVIQVKTFRPLGEGETAEVTDEALRLAGFTSPGAAQVDVQIVSAG